MGEPRIHIDLVEEPCASCKSLEHVMRIGRGAKDAYCILCITDGTDAVMEWNHIGVVKQSLAIRANAQSIRSERERLDARATRAVRPKR